MGTTVYERQPTARDVIVAALENTKLKPFSLDDDTNVEREALTTEPVIHYFESSSHCALHALRKDSLDLEGLRRTSLKCQSV